MADKPPFDPNKPFTEVGGEKPAFDPNQPFEEVSESLKKKELSNPLSTSVKESKSEIHSTLNKVGSVSSKEEQDIQSFLDNGQLKAGTPPTPGVNVSQAINAANPIDLSNNILDQKKEEDPFKDANDIAIKHQDELNNKVKADLVGDFGRSVVKDEFHTDQYFMNLEKQGYSQPEIEEAKKGFMQSIGAVMPIKPETSYGEGSLKTLDLALADTYRTIDNAVKLIDKATGMNGRGGLFEDLAIGSEMHAEKLKDMPEGLAGEVTKGVVGTLPLLAQLALTPELGVPKLAAALGANAFVNTLQNTTKDKKDISFSDLIPATQAGVVEGVKGGILHSLGYGSNVLGETIKAATGSPLVGGAAASLLNSAGFAGFDAADQFIHTGSVDMDRVAASFGTGIAFSAPMLKKALEESAKTKATENFFSTEPGAIAKIIEKDIKPEEMRNKAIELGDLASKETDINKKNELLLAKKTLDKIVDVHAVWNDVLIDPKKYIKEINETKGIGAEDKQMLTDHVNKILNEVDPKTAEARPISEEINKRKEALSVIESDRTLDKNISEAKKKPLENEIKELSRKLQAVYDPIEKAKMEAEAIKEKEKTANEESKIEAKSEKEPKVKTPESIVEPEVDLTKTISGKEVEKSNIIETPEGNIENKEGKWIAEDGSEITGEIEVKKLEEKLAKKNEKIVEIEDKKEILPEIDKKISELEKSTFGSESKKIEDFNNKDNEGKLQSTLLPNLGKLQDKVWAEPIKTLGQGIAKAVEKMSVDNNKLKRGIADIVRSIAPRLAIQGKNFTAADNFHGEVEYATSEASHMNAKFKEMIDSDPIALSKIDRLIDPEFYKESPETAIKIEDLTPAERDVYEAVKNINEIVHDISFATGGISKEVYLKNKGKYAARLYDVMEIPTDVEAKMNEQYNKEYDGGYKKRGEIDDWKKEHKIEDPVYTATTRLRQAMINKAVFDRANEVVTKEPQFVSDVEKPGFVKLADKGYGELSGKHVSQNIAEDFQGFFYQNKTLNDTYKLLKTYDQWGPRQFYKKLFTVYNPGVHVGNIMGDNIFGFLSGVDPLTLNKNIGFAHNEVKNYGETYRFLIKKGLLKTDLTRGDMVESLANLQKAKDVASESKNPLKVLSDKAKDFYGGVDDHYKIAAFKSLIDSGVPAEMAVERVAEGFQNYRRVGKLYDFTSKIPVIGQPFGKFAGDLGRIMTNAATTRPLNLAAFGATLHFIASMTSAAAGESNEDRKTRENRPGAAKIPLPESLGGNISLDWLTGGKMINVARFVSPVFIYGSPDAENDKTAVLKKFLPMSLEVVDRTGNPNGPTAVTIAKNINDPLFTWMQLLVDSDFRGKQIIDPTTTKYSAGVLSNHERVLNSLRFLGRNYIPYGSLGDDLVSAALGKEGYYSKRTVPQVLMRFAGVKIEDFPKDKYDKIRESQLKSVTIDFTSNAESIKKIRKMLKKKEITEEIAQDRLAPLMEDQIKLIKELDTSGIPSAGLSRKLKKR